VSWWLYMTFVNDKKEKPESKDTGEENTDQSTEQQTGGESSNTEQKKTSRKSKGKSLPKLVEDTQNNPKLPESEPVNPVDAGEFDDAGEGDTTIKDLGTSKEKGFEN